MTDMRKVWPKEALTAERMTSRGYSWWEVEMPVGPSHVLRDRSFIDAEFAATFVDAAVFTEVIDTVRSQKALHDLKWYGSCPCELCVALAAFDAVMLPDTESSALTVANPPAQDSH